MKKRMRNTKYLIIHEKSLYCTFKWGTFGGKWKSCWSNHNKDAKIKGLPRTCLQISIFIFHKGFASTCFASTCMGKHAPYTLYCILWENVNINVHSSKWTKQMKKTRQRKTPSGTNVNNRMRNTCEVTITKMKKKKGFPRTCLQISIFIFHKGFASTVFASACMGKHAPYTLYCILWKNININLHSSKWTKQMKETKQRQAPSGTNVHNRMRNTCESHHFKFDTDSNQMSLKSLKLFLALNDIVYFCTYDWLCSCL